MFLAASSVDAQTQTPAAQSPSDATILDASKFSPDHKDGTTPPSCQYMPPPPYTKEARKAKYEGIAVVEAIIELDGRLSNMRIVKSPGLGLDESVLQTLKKWRCTPAKGPDGKFKRTSIPFEVTFRLGSGH